MRVISLLPADVYSVVNKSILTEIDRKNLLSLYEPIIGAIAVSLYLTLWRDLGLLELFSREFNHHHLMTILKSDLNSIKEAREALEALGLLKTYFRAGEINNYVYELYSPMSADEFFSHPVLNIVLYNNIGKSEYDLLKCEYEIVKVDLKEYEDISKKLNMTFKSSNTPLSFDVKRRSVNDVIALDQVDIDQIIVSLPKGLINEKMFNKKMRELINNLAFIYDLDTLKVSEMLRLAVNEKGFIEKDTLRKQARKYYQYNNNGSLPTLVYRTQPDYLKNPSGDNTNRGKIIRVFENTSPYDFLKNKYKGVAPTSRDLKLLESLIIDLGLTPAVVNVLIDYVLRKNNNKLNQAFVETIAGQWKRMGISRAEEAMDVAEKEHKKYSKKATAPKKFTKEAPVWFNEQIQKEEVSAEEQVELEELLKEFR